MDRHLHIVSFDIPWPADYGGVIDVFYKVKAIAAAGVKVHLHCFAYGRARSAELDALCESVHYYKRNMNKTLLTHPLPFIVVSRQSTALFNRLMEDDYPILFEGKHSAYLLNHPDLASRKKFVRTHNIESEYYKGLAKNAGFLKKQYFKRESKKLARFKENLKFADGLFSISPNDATYFSQCAETMFVPPFHANEEVETPLKKEPYALYHGNLAVSENEEAATYLIKEVFAQSNKRLVIYGSAPSQALSARVASHQNIEIIKDEDLLSLIRNAQVNVLPTFQATGMKLKLLFSLFNGGHIVVNEPMVKDTGLETLCHIADSAEHMKQIIDFVWDRPLKEEELARRNTLLQKQFSNKRNASKMLERIFKDS